MRTFIASLDCLVTLLTATAIAADHGEGITLNFPDKLEWKDGPPSLPKGARIAVLKGDPNKEAPFVFRVKVPDGYRIPPHTHPKLERVTVIADTFNIGMGAKVDKDATDAMPAGTYGFWEPGIAKHQSQQRSGPATTSLHPASGDQQPDGAATRRPRPIELAPSDFALLGQLHGTVLQLLPPARGHLRLLHLRSVRALRHRQCRESS